MASSHWHIGKVSMPAMLMAGCHRKNTTALCSPASYLNHVLSKLQIVVNPDQWSFNHHIHRVFAANIS
jgi:hypothetical protein